MDFTDYLKGLDSIGLEVELSLGGLGEVNTALYVASGCDVALPVRLLPNVRVTVLVDNHPFVPFAILDRDTLSGHIGPADPWGSPWFENKQHDGRSMCNYILGNLVASAHGSVEVKRVRLISNIHTLSDEPRCVMRLVHGVIYYTVNADVTVRRVIYLNMYISSSNPFQEREWPVRDSWWLKRLDKLQPEAVFFKGSADAFTPGYGHQAFRDSVPKWLKAKNGFLFQGECFYPHRGMFEFEDPWRFGRECKTKVVSGGKKYSYGDTVTVTKFASLEHDPEAKRLRQPR